MIYRLLACVLVVSCYMGTVSAQEDSITVRRIFQECLKNNTAYDNLRVLCKQVGHRLSGSEGSKKAVIWGEAALRAAGADSVWLQPVKVPHWERGKPESVTMKTGKQSRTLKALALGGSIATPASGIEAEVVMVKSKEELEQLGRKKVEGKIVFFNHPFDDTHLRTFESYGSCVWQRVDGAIQAARFGAVGCVIRSLTHIRDDNPHTGVMQYVDSLPKVPGLALGYLSANALEEALTKGQTVRLNLKTNCKTLPDADSYNVIGELKANRPNAPWLVVGGHLDSWDVGEGAHDDGAGVVQSIEVLRLMKKLGLAQRFNIRCILFMNEENGARGARKYAEEAERKNEPHAFGLESDAGGFTPRGFTFEKLPENIPGMDRIRYLFAPYGLHDLSKGGSGVDVGYLRKPFPMAVLSGYRPDSQRYFDVHHAHTDVFETVHPRELALGAASMAALMYMMSIHLP